MNLSSKDTYPFPSVRGGFYKDLLWLLYSPITMLSQSMAKNVENNLDNFQYLFRWGYILCMFKKQQESIPVGCEPPACRPYVLHNEQI